MKPIQFPPSPPKVRESVYQVPHTERRRVADNPQRRSKEDPTDPGPQKYYIQGKRARTTEWNLYKALLRLGFGPQDIQFQVGFNGGRNFKNGFVVDFILNTKPQPTPIWVHGDYWHQGEQSGIDFMQQQTLNRLYPGAFARAAIFWGADVVNEETAFFAAIDKFGRP